MTESNILDALRDLTREISKIGFYNAVSVEQGALEALIIEARKINASLERIATVMEEDNVEEE